MQNQHTIASLSARPSPSLPSRPRFTYILSLYFYDASGGFPPSLPISLSLSLHLVSLSSRGKGGGGLCQPFCALHDMKRTDGRCVSSPPRAHVVSPLRPCRAKRGANERTTRRADGRGRHLCLMDRLKVRKTTRGPPPEFRPNHLCQDKKRKDPSVPFPSQNTRVGSLVSSPRPLGFDKVVRTKTGSDGFKGFFKNVSLIFARKTRWRRVELESPQTLFFSRRGEEIGSSSFTCSGLGSSSELLRGPIQLASAKIPF